MNEFVDYLRLRAMIYRVLAAPFHKESTAAYLEELKRYIPVFMELGTDELRQAASGLQAYFDENAVTEQLIDAHERIFARLFLCVIPEQSSMKSVCPQESPYLSANGLIMQEPRDEIIELMIKEKTGLSKDFNEPEDHLSAEFHFMATLSSRLSEIIADGRDDAAADNLETQSMLIQKHLVRWIPLVCRDLVKESRTVSEKAAANYFITIAALTEAFIKFDAAWLMDLTKPAA